MALARSEKSEIIKKYQQHESDTGSAHVQIALLTKRIVGLTKHLKMYKNDTKSRYALTSKVVSLRRRLMKYLKRKNAVQYWDLVTALEIRG